MTINILTMITLLLLTLFQQKCLCWIENLNHLHVSPVSIPSMEDRVYFLKTSTTDTPVKFRYEALPNSPESDLKLKRVVTIPNMTSRNVKIDTQLGQSSNLRPTNRTIEAPKPLVEPPYETDDTRKITIQLKPNKWAFGPTKDKELKWKPVSGPEHPKGFYFKVSQRQLKEDNGPVEVIQQVNVTNGLVNQNGIHAYVRRDLDPVPKPNTHIYIKVVSDGTGIIDPVTIHDPEIVYHNGSYKFPSTDTRQTEGNYSSKAFGVKEVKLSRNLPETDPDSVKSFHQDQEISLYKSYQERNGSSYGDQPPKLVEIEPTTSPPPQNVTIFNVSKPIQYSPRIPVDYPVQPDSQENPYNPIKRVVQDQYVLNQPHFHVTTPSYFSNPDYNGYQPEYHRHNYGFQAVTPPIISSKPDSFVPTPTTTTTTTPLPTKVEPVTPPLIPTIPSTDEFNYFNDNPSSGLKENVTVLVTHHSAYPKNDTEYQDIKRRERIEVPSLAVPNDPNAKHVYFNIHHEQHIKHDNGKTTLNTNPVYQVNIIPQYPSAPVHVSLKNNERVTVISSDNGHKSGSFNISVVSSNGTLQHESDDVENTLKPITEIKKLTQLSRAGQTGNKLDTESKVEERSPTSVNDILRAIARSGQAAVLTRNSKRSRNSPLKDDEPKPSTTSNPVRKFTFQTVETTPLENDTWNNVFEKFQYLARKTLKNDKNRTNNSDVISSLKTLTPDVQKDRGYLPNKYFSVSPLPLTDEGNDPKNTPLPTQAKAYVELKIKDSSERISIPEEEMKTFPPGVSKRDWSERMPGQQNKRDLLGKIEKPETAPEVTTVSVNKTPNNPEMFQNVKYETIVENGQIDNVNSHSFPFKHVTESTYKDEDNRNNNQEQYQSERTLDENIDNQRHPGNQRLPTSLYKLPVGRLPDPEPQLSFQQDEFLYGGKRYKIKNGYAYEDDGGVPQHKIENGALGYVDPSLIENPGDLQLGLSPADNDDKNQRSRKVKVKNEQSAQITPTPVYEDGYVPLPKQKNVLSLNEKRNKPRPNFHRAPVKALKNRQNQNSFKTHGNNNNFKPNGPPGLVLNNFSPNLGATINAPGIGNIRIVLVPQNQKHNQSFHNQNALTGIHIPISIPVTQIPQNYQIESNQHNDGRNYQTVQPPESNNNNNGGNNRPYQGSPQQDEDYPANERYRESNHNKQYDYNQNDKLRQGNQYGQYDQPQTNYDQQNEQDYQVPSTQQLYNNNADQSNYDSKQQQEQGPQNNNYQPIFNQQNNQQEQPKQNHNYQPIFNQPNNQQEQPPQNHNYQPIFNQQEQAPQNHNYQPSFNYQNNQPEQSPQNNNYQPDFNHQNNQPEQSPQNNNYQQDFNHQNNQHEQSPQNHNDQPNLNHQDNQLEQAPQNNNHQSDFNHQNNQQSYPPQNHHVHQKPHQFQPTYIDRRNQYKGPGNRPRVITNQHTPRYNYYESQNAPYDNSFQPQEPFHRENIPQAIRKPSKQIAQFHLQLPPDYDADSQRNANEPKELNLNPPQEERQKYREHRERITKDIYNNDDIPPMPSFPGFTPSMPHFPFQHYEARRIRKSPPSTTTATIPSKISKPSMPLSSFRQYEPRRVPKSPSSTTNPTPSTTQSLVTPTITPIRVQVANPSDSSKSPITLLLYIDPKGLINYNDNWNTKK